MSDRAKQFAKYYDQCKLPKWLDYAVNLIANLAAFFESATYEVKIKLLGSIFPEKIVYDGKKYRTNSYNEVLDLIYQETKQLRGGGIKKRLPAKEGVFNSVPATGVISNQLLEDLDRIWALRDVIPNP